MPRPRKVPAVLVEATIRRNAKLADLPSDSARLGYVYVVLGEAKLTAVPGLFDSKSHFREVAGRFARFVDDYVRVGVLEVAPRLCSRCKPRWTTPSPRSGSLVVHDWHDHQYDPRKIERQREYEERQRADSEAQSDGVSDAQSDAGSDGVSDAFPTGDSRAHARSRAPNVERRTENGFSSHEEDRSSSRSGERADIAALHDRGWKRVTKAQRRVLDEILSRHDVTGPEFAAEAIRCAPDDADPLEAAMAADRVWQDAQRRRADAEASGWQATKDQERADAERIATDPPEWLRQPVEAGPFS